VVGISSRHTDRTVKIGQMGIGCLCLCLLNPALHFADRVKVLLDLGAIARADAIFGTARQPWCPELF